MAHSHKTAQSMKLPVEEAAAVGLTFSQQQLSPQQQIVQVAKSGQHHLSQSVYVIERPSVVTSTNEIDTSILRRPASQESQPQIIHLNAQQIVSSPKLLQFRRPPVKTYSSAQQTTVRKRTVNQVLKCVQSLPPSLNKEPQQVQTSLEPHAAQRSANVSPQQSPQQLPLQQCAQQAQSPQVRAKAVQQTMVAASPQNQRQLKQQFPLSINPEPLKQSLPRLLQRGKNSTQNTPNVSQRSVVLDPLRTVQTLKSQSVSKIHPSVEDQHDITDPAKEEQPVRQVIFTSGKPLQQIKQMQVVHQKKPAQQTQVKSPVVQVKHLPQAHVQQLPQSTLKQIQATQQVQAVQQVKPGQHRQLIKPLVQTKQEQTVPRVKLVHPAHQMKQVPVVPQSKEVTHHVKPMQSVKLVEEEENCNRLSKLLLENSGTEEVGLNIPAQTEDQDALTPSIAVSNTNAVLNRVCVQTVDDSPGNRKPQVTSNNLVFERQHSNVPLVASKSSSVPISSPSQQNQSQPQPKPVNSQSSNIINQSPLVAISSNQSPHNLQVSHPQVTFLSFKPGQSIGHQPENSNIRLIQTGPIAKQIAQMHQQHQVVQLALPQQQLVQLAMSSNQQVIHIPGHQILQSTPTLYQVQQSTQTQQPQIIQVQAHTLPIQQQVQLQLPSTDLQAQLQAQQQAQLQAQQQAQLTQQTLLQVQQQAQLQAQQQAQLQAQQLAQLQAQQQAQLQAQQQAQLQVQQQAHLQTQQQLKTQLQSQQVQLQAQVHQGAQQHSMMLQVHPQPQVQTQQEEQQLDQQDASLEECELEFQEEQTQMKDEQLNSQQGSALLVQQPKHLVRKSTTGPVSESLPPNNQNRATNIISNYTTDSAQEVKQIQLSRHQQSTSKHSKARLSTSRVPQPKKVPLERTLIMEPMQHDLTQLQSACSEEERIQELVKKVQLPPPPTGFVNRVVANRHQDGQLSLIFQQVPAVAQDENVSQLQEVQQMIAPVEEEEQVTLFDGVSVESEFLTGVPQECVVSESGELVLAEMDSRTDVIASGCAQQHAEQVTSNFSPSRLPELQEPDHSQTERPKRMPGYAAVCKHCGVLSDDLDKCQRCNSVLKDAKLIKVQSNLNKINRVVESPMTLIRTVEPSMLRRELILPSVRLGVKPLARTLQPLLVGTSGSEVKRKRCSTPRTARPKVPEEPEILTLSSDDEEKHEKPPKKLDAESRLLANSCASEHETEEESREGAAAAAEESDLEETRKQSAGVAGGGMLQQVIDGSIASPFVVVSCRTVRVGTYKEKPLEKVVISTQGLELNLALPSGSDVTVNIPMQDVSRVLASFCRQMPIVFIYLRTAGGARVREIMQMTDPKSSYYYQPESSDELRKRIILLPDKITEEMKMNIKRIFENKKKIFAEINNSLANEILVKSTQNLDSSLRTRTGASASEIQTLMVYPPPPSKGGISINTEDYACLGDDQFLNDVIIDFYLKYLMQSVLSEEDRERTHVFSSFFYKRLTSKPKVKGRRHPIEDDPKLSAAEKRHARVKTWTKNVNLFTKDFIIIPINESCHWFLAIICFPGQDGCLRISDNTPIDLPKPQPKPSPAAAVAAAAVAAAATTHSKLKVKDNVISIGSTTITPVKAPASSTITLDNHGDDGSDRDEAEGDEEEMAENASDEEDSGQTESESNGSKLPTEDSEGRLDTDIGNSSGAPSNDVPKTKTPIVREGIKQPCILIFDSLVGAPRYRVAATLREYLTIEYKVKEGKSKLFTKDTIKGMLPKVPQQNNFTDCGLYLLQYVEMFFKDPIRDYHAPIKQLVNWFSEEIVSRKREEISNLLKDLMREQNIDPDKLSLPSLFSTASAPQVNAAQMTEDQEALARLAQADKEAQQDIARRQLAMLKKSSEPLVAVEHLDQGTTYESEVVVPNNADSTKPLEAAQDSAIENEDALVTGERFLQSNSLVDYASSADESDSASTKRTPNPIDEEDVIEKKKLKVE